MKRLLFGLILGSVVLTIALLFPYSSRPADSLPNSVDPVFYAWNLMHNVQSVTHGFKDLLDTNIFYPEGNTLALSDTLYAQSVITSPIILLTKNPVLAENLYVLATFPLAVLTMFLLCYYLTGSGLSSVLAGIFFAFSYPRLAQVGHMPALSSQWLPLVFLYLIRWLRDKKFRHLFWVFFWFLLSITSTMYFGVFLIPLSLVIIAFEWIGTSKKDTWHLIRHFLILFVPAAVILVIALFPYIRLRAEYPGIRRSLQDASRLSALPVDYLSVLPTSWLGDIGLTVNTNERALYPTVTLVALGLLSCLLVQKAKRKMQMAFFSLAVAALVLSFGPYYGSIKLPYYFLYKVYPLLESIRVPARFSIFFILGLAVSASFGLQRLIERKGGSTIAALVALLFLIEVWQQGVIGVPVPVWANAPPIYRYIASAPDNPIVVELPLHPEWKSLRMEDQLTLPYAYANENDVYALEAYRTYFSAFHGKRMLNGYSGYFPNIYHDHSIALDNFPTAESISVLEKEHVGYILVHSGEYVNIPYSDVAKNIRSFPELKLTAQFGSDYLYELIQTGAK